MSKLDYLTLTITIFLLSLVWSAYFMPRWIYAILLSAAVSLIATITAYYLKNKGGKPYAADRLALELSVHKPEYLINIFKSILKNADFESGSDYILLKDCLIVSAFKFSPLSVNDVGNILTLASDKGRTEVFVLARGADRKAAYLLRTHGITLTVVRIRAIYSFLEKHNALPPLNKEKKKCNLRVLPQAVFSRLNTKNYIFSGAVLLSAAFLTPLKIYYLVFGSILLCLALLTLTPLGNGGFKTQSVFDKLTEETKQSEIDE